MPSDIYISGFRISPIDSLPRTICTGAGLWKSRSASLIRLKCCRTELDILSFGVDMPSVSFTTQATEREVESSPRARSGRTTLSSLSTVLEEILSRSTVRKETRFWVLQASISALNLWVFPWSRTSTSAVGSMLTVFFGAVAWWLARRCWCPLLAGVGGVRWSRVWCGRLHRLHPRSERHDPDECSWARQLTH